MRYLTHAGTSSSSSAAPVAPESVKLTPHLARWFSRVAPPPRPASPDPAYRPAFVAPIPFAEIPQTPPPAAAQWRCDADAPRAAERAAERAAALLRDALASEVNRSDAIKDARRTFGQALDAAVLDPLTTLVTATSEALEAPPEVPDAAAASEVLALRCARLYSMVNPRLATLCRNAARTLLGMASDAFPPGPAEFADARRMNHAAMFIDTVDRPALLHGAIALLTGVGVAPGEVAEGVLACLSKKHTDTFALNANHRLGAGLPHDERTLAADGVDRMGPKGFYARGARAAREESAAVLAAARSLAPSRARYTLRSLLKAAGPVGG